MAKGAKKLVIQHLENISRKALEKYQPLIREYVKGKQGVYALYRGDRLKYVGLASDLRWRLMTHLRDRHAQTWDKFSVYLTADDEHLRELEALVIRIAAPRENRVKGKLKGAENLRRRFMRDVGLWQKKEKNELMGIEQLEESEEDNGKPRARRRKRSRESARPGKKPSLAFVGKWFRIRADYKGKRYKAKVRANGKINLNGKLYSSPSFAAMAITKTTTINGWKIWKYKNEKGQWVWIDELRKK